MTVEEFYNKVGGDYNSIFAMFKSDERIIKFLKMFPEDPNFALLKESFEKSDCETAFRAAHTMKGTCSNLQLSRLQKSASEITENLRDLTFKDNTAELLAIVEKDYIEVRDALAELLA